ncbi:MAG: CvpA family protein [Candidatus Binatia bacterium]
MTSIDAALAVVLVLCALRGYWRGFLREFFGLLGLVGGVAAAFQFTAAGVAMLRVYATLPAPLLTGAVFVVIFVVFHAGLNLVGVLLNHLARTPLLHAVNGLAGAVVGAGKGAAVLALVLLFLHLFPFAPALDARIMTSTIGRPLVNVAGDVIRAGSRATRRPDSPSQA